jgi:cardiolipin synthase
MGLFWWIATLLHLTLVVACLINVLRRRKEPASMLAWVLAITSAPVLGALVYWLIGSDRLPRKARRRRRRVAHLLAQLKEAAEHRARGHRIDYEAELPADLAAIERLGGRLADMPATSGNGVAVLQDANNTYAALEEAIRAAEHHVHMQYYIWQPDDTGRHFRDLVVGAARRGVQCRLLLDAVGCFWLGRRFLAPLHQAGVQVAFFLPLLPLRFGRRWSAHLRNHRKIVIVDGQTAFTGSQNIGDEYRGRLKALSPWYDTHLRIRGPAALFLQQTFAEDWYLAARERLDQDQYFPMPVRGGGSVVQVLPTGPDHSVSTLAQVFFAAVSSAGQSIRIATPYFVPDLAMRMALAHAAYRGVQVRLVIPSRSDVPLALWAGRSFYAELLDAGVQIHEFDGGVLHSKLFTVDDRWCVVGSANMDARSFRLNFEITAVIYDSGVATALSAAIDGYCAAGRPITPKHVWHRPLWQQLGEGAARLLTPIL